MNEEILIDILRNISKDSLELEPQYTEIRAAIDSVFVPQNAQQFSATNAKYHTVMAKLDKVIRQSQQALAIAENKEIAKQENTVKPIIRYQSQTIEIPEPPPIKIHKPGHMWELFKSRELPQVKEPYPSLCGSLPGNTEEVIDVDGFVAVKLETDGDYALCYVVGYEDGNYKVIDVVADPATPITKPKEDVLPLPTSLALWGPNRPEHPINSVVLALWPEGANDWTSIFYPAKVVKMPTKRKRGYGLKFEGDNDHEWIYVPEQFVLGLPEK